MKTICKKIPLKEIATFLNGYAFKPNDWSKEGLPIIRIQNLTGTNKEFNYYNGKYNEKYIIENGDILISWSASLGIFLWENMRGILNQHIFKVIFDKNIEIDKTYFLHCMKYLIKKIEKNIHGSTMKHITRPEFEKINFPIYDIDIQRKIAKKLVFISEIIDNNKRILVKLMDLSKSLFTKIFGDIKTNDKNWKIESLDNIYWIRSSKRVFEKDYKKDGIPFFRSKEVVGLSQSKNINPEIYISIDKYEELKKISGIPLKDDLLVTAVGTIGKIWKVDYEKEFYFKDGNLIWLQLKKPHNFFNPLSLKKILEEFINKEKENLSSGSAYNALTIDKLKKFSIFIPPIELQNKFAERIEKIEKLKFTIMTIILNTYETMKKKGVEKI